MPCRQITGLHASTIGSKGNVPKVTKSVVGLYTLNLDTKEHRTHTWILRIDGVQVATGAMTLAPLASINWYQAVPWQTIPPGLHTFTLESTNAYGTNVHTIQMYVLIGDVDNNIINMLDFYIVAENFGQIC